MTRRWCSETIVYEHHCGPCGASRLARAARSLKHLIELAETLRERGIDLFVLKQGIDTSTPTGRRATLTATQVRMARQMYDSEEYTVQQIAATFHTSRATISQIPLKNQRLEPPKVTTPASPQTRNSATPLLYG